jgi:hypothetical protein
MQPTDVYLCEQNMCHSCLPWHAYGEPQSGYARLTAQYLSNEGEKSG